MNFADRVPPLAAALWWGSLTAIGFIAVPTLFANLPTPAQAGQAAAKLFTSQAWTSVGCAMLLLVGIRRSGRNELLGWVLAGALLALLMEFAVAPRIVLRENLAFWHAAGTGMYFGQWVCAGAVLWKLLPR